MRMEKIRVAVVGVGFLVAACGAPEDDNAQWLSALKVTQELPFKSLSDGHVIAGSEAKLTRDSDTGVSIKAETRELNPGEAVDVLWAVFNNPGACTNGNPVTGAPCGPPDLFNAATGGSLHYVATLNADGAGELSYSASLAKGDLSTCIGGPFPCNGITNVLGAEVHSPLFTPNGGPGRQAAQFVAP
jgi:hypothetical protein